jgi:hypothetical protein
MSLILSRILYYIGDFISRLFYWRLFRLFSGLLYPIYNKVMIWSSELDKDGVIWKNVNDE